MVLKKQLAEDEVIKTAKNCALSLIEKKANDVVLMDLKKINSYLDFFIVCTGNSHIHCAALAKEAQKYFKDSGFKEISKPRMDTGWIALDFNEIVIHIFTEELRNYYQLERLWGDADFIGI